MLFLYIFRGLISKYRDTARRVFVLMVLKLLTGSKQRGSLPALALIIIIIMRYFLYGYKPYFNICCLYTPKV